MSCFRTIMIFFSYYLGWYSVNNCKRNKETC